MTGVTLDRTELTLPDGTSAQLTATVTPSKANNKVVIWESSDPSIATVEGGRVTAVTPGDAVITATTEDGGFTAQCNVFVIAPIW